MKRLHRLTLSLFALSAMLWACGEMAPSSFDGTWKADPEQTKFSSEPVTISLENGVYDCTSCKPKIHVKADGNEQVLTAQSHDTIKIIEIDSSTARTIIKRNGKITLEQVDTASPDGKTLRATMTIYPIQGTVPETQEFTSARIGLPVPNANAISGSWRIQKVTVPENFLLTTFKSNGHELSAYWQVGTNWAAKFDGKDYPVNGGFRADSVSLKRLDNWTIEAAYKFHGYLTRVDKLTVSHDAKTMTTVSEDKIGGRITTRSATRQ